MKKIVFLSCIFFAFSWMTVQAQKHDRRMSAPERANWMIEKMQENMNLTAQQQQELRSVFEVSFTKMHSIRQNGKGDREATREALRKNHEDMQAAVQKVLTPEQYKQYLTMQQQCKNYKGDGSKRHGNHMRHRDRN